MYKENSFYLGLLIEIYFINLIHCRRRIKRYVINTMLEPTQVPC